MTKLLEIFDIAANYDASKIWDTKAFFSEPIERRRAFNDLFQQMDDCEHFFNRLTEDSGPYSLSDGEHSIDYLYLMESKEVGRVKEIYVKVRWIRQEIVNVATKDEFDEMKSLLEFWEGLEMPMMAIAKEN